MSVTFASLANKNFRWLLGGNIAQFFAVSSRMMLCNLLAWELTGKEISLAFINVSLAIPMFTGALIAGAFVDRFERRRLILTGLVIISISELSIVVALFLDQLNFVHLLLITFIGGCAHPFVHPASIAMMYNLLGRSHIANGVALLSSGMSLSRILGPALTGGVLAFINATVAYAMVAMLFVVALICQWHLPEDIPTKKEQETVAKEIKKGIRYLFADRAIGLSLMFSFPPLMLLMTTQYMLVLFADQVWGVGEAGLGLLLTAMGVGAFLGAMAVARFGGNFRRIKVMFVSALSAAVLFTAFSQSPIFGIALLFLVGANMSAAICMVTNQVVVQLLVKDEARGRVSGYILMTYSLAPLALFPLSILADKIGVNNAVTIAAAVVSVLVTLFMVGSGALRNIDNELSTKKS